jgi:cationic amino acid transporter 14
VFSTVCNVVNLAVIGFIIITGAFYVKRENWSQKSGFFPFGVSGVLGGAATCFYAFAGFDVIATTGQETKNPQRSIPLAIMISLFIVFMCYFSVSSIITLMLPYYKLDKLSPIPDAFAQRGLHIATYFVGIGAVCGLSSSLMGSLFPLPRIIYAMANDGLLFEPFRKISFGSDIPLVATIYPGILTAIFALVFNLDELVEMMSLGTLLAYTLVSLCVLILRYQPDSHLGAGDISSDSSVYFGELALTDNRASENSEKEKVDGTFETDDTPVDNLDESGIDSGNLGKKRAYMDMEMRTSMDEICKNEEFVVKASMYQRGEKRKNMNAKNLRKPELDEDSSGKQGEERLYVNNLVHKEKTVWDNNETVQFSFPTKKTGRIVCCASFLLCISSFMFFALMIHALDLILRRDYLVISLTLIMGFLSIICIGVITAMPQNSSKLSFNVPCVPGIPIMAIFFNILLIMKLSRVTWLRFVIWMVIGKDGSFIQFLSCFFISFYWSFSCSKRNRAADGGQFQKC